MAQISLGKVVLTHGGDYNIATTYEAITLVRYNNALYLSLQNGNVGHNPDDTNSEWWKLISKDGKAPIIVPCTAANMTTYGIQSGVTLDEAGETVVANDISNNIYRLIIVNAVGTASQTATATPNLLYNVGEIADAINTILTQYTNE